MRSFATILTTLSVPLFAFAAYHGGHPRAHAGLAARARGDVLHQRDFSGRFTYYDITTGLTACGGSYGSGAYVVALNAAQFGDVPGSSQYCGASITITYNGKSVPATVVDKCPGCPYGGLDLTEGVFRALAGGLDAGVIYGSWSLGSGSGSAPKEEPKPTSTTPKYTPPKTTSTPHYDPPTTTSHYDPPSSSSHHQNTPSPTPETTSTPSPPPPSSSSTSAHKISSSPSTTSTTSPTYTSHSYSSSTPADTPTSSVPPAPSGLADPAGTIDDSGEPEVIASLYDAIIGLGYVIEACQT